MDASEKYELLVRDLVGEFGRADLSGYGGLRGILVTGKNLAEIDRPDLIVAIKQTVEAYSKGLSGVMKFYSLRQPIDSDSVVLVFHHPSFEMHYYPSMSIYILETNHGRK